MPVRIPYRTAQGHWVRGRHRDSGNAHDRIIQHPEWRVIQATEGEGGRGVADWGLAKSGEHDPCAVLVVIRTGLYNDLVTASTATLYIWEAPLGIAVLGLVSALQGGTTRSCNHAGCGLGVRGCMGV